MLNHHNSWVIKLASTAGALERRAPSLHPMRHWPGVIATTEDKQAKQTTRRTVASKLDLTLPATPQFRKKVLGMFVNVMDTRRWAGLSEVWPVSCLLHITAQLSREEKVATSCLTETDTVTRTLYRSLHIMHSSLHSPLHTHPFLMILHSCGMLSPWTVDTYTGQLGL